MEIDWYWPTDFAGKKYTWGVEGKLYNAGNYSKEIGTIEFEDITFDTFDAILGVDEGDEGSDGDEDDDIDEVD
jgi:hypothetical protein